MKQKTKTKIFAVMVFSLLSMNLAAAGIFDWLLGTPEVEEIKIPAFNISNDFNTKKLTLDTETICIKDGDKLKKDKKCEQMKPDYETVDLSDSNYFYENSEGMVRFQNG